ncbi:ARC6/PARC6 family protein [Microcoleus sp. herbarium12]|jgi:ARC6-like, IMS domain|uniref:ARC6/PARC6 family protein n=1 Tax=Microcoleus sp. herbarium12 TaxID=3055437 RepID=UPI002FD0342D
MKAILLVAIATPLFLAAPAPAINVAAGAKQIPATNYISQAPNITLGQASDLIGKWLDAKQKIFAPPFDRQLLAKMTTGILYSDTVKAIDYLTASNSRYRYGVQKLESVERFAASGNKATIEVKITEDATLYKNGKVDSSSFNTKLIRYSLEYWDGIWKIADSQLMSQ